MNKLETIYIQEIKIEKFKQEIKIIILTATDLEKEQVLSRLQPIYKNKIYKIQSESNTYTIGKMGIYPVVHVHTEKGNSSILVTEDTIKKWSPILLIMVGIAFGKDKRKQKIGDVLISEGIIQYEPSKIVNGKYIHRGNIVSSGKVLFDRFNSCNEWMYKLEENSYSNKITGKILSGEKLIDDKAFKEKLLAAFPEAIGGEMEGSGVYLSSFHNNINEWIIVKGICDWGVNKSANKLANQKLAIEAAVSLCEQVLSIKYTFSTLEIKMCTEINIDELIDSIYKPDTDETNFKENNKNCNINYIEHVDVLTIDQSFNKNERN